MARAGSRESALGRLLAAAPGAVYALDDQRKIVYCNVACAELLGIEPGSLIGQRCDYRTTSEQPTIADVACSLCPPPEVLSGLTVEASLALLHVDGPLLNRRVSFQPLGSDALHCVGVLAFVGDAVLSEMPSGTVPSGTVPSDAVSSDAVSSGTVPNPMLLAGHLPANVPRVGVSLQTESSALHRRLWELRRTVLAGCGVDELVGISPVIERVRQQVELASHGQSRVLVHGPCGSGREHVARLLHQRATPERLGQVVPLCCPLLDAELLQTTITGLLRQCHALELESARAGEEGYTAPTLLLLEVDQLSAEAQAELAGFLTLPGLDLFAVATAEHGLIELAQQGRFSKELAFALSTLIIEMPPLSQRAEDIPVLCQYFLERFNAQGGRQLSGFSSEALDELAGYGWPDNVDELSELVELACQRAEGPEVEQRDLPSQIQWAHNADAHPPKTDEPIELDAFLARIEKELIVRALRRCKGNKTRAAQLLGMNRARFHRRLEYFEIS